MEKRIGITWALVFAALVVARDAAAVECVAMKGAGGSYTVCRVDPSRESLRLAYSDAHQVRYGSFARLAAELARAEHKLVFAMNAGMFHPDYKPVGLLVIDGRELAPINRAQAFGNFYLQPNGVFLVEAGHARVLATDDYRGLTPTFATQSGPMLLHRGQIPDIPAFRATSRSRNLRNGVCVPNASTVAFVISEDAVTLREFAEFFRDGLKCDEALYFDGSISSLYAPQLRRADARASLGPIVAVVE